MIKNQTHISFLSLVRLGIGHQAPDLPETIDWKSVRALANEQGLAAIVLDGAQALMDRGEMVGERLMEVPLKKEWIGNVILNYEHRYSDYRKRIGELAGFYNRNGFKMMVLKGYGLSLDWPVPAHRPAGDIDIWLFGRYREADRLISEKEGIHIDDTHIHHTVFDWHGFMVENHFDFVNTLVSRSNARIETLFKRLAEDDSNSIGISGEKVFLPSPNLHLLFLLRHSILHFNGEGLVIRQILDWGFFIEKHGSEIDWSWIEKVLEDFGIRRFFDCLNAICIEDLGFDKSLFPSVDFDSSLRDRVVEDLLNPEFSEDEPDRLLPRIIFKLRRLHALKWKHYLCYDESRLGHILSSLLMHIKKPEMI